MSGFMRPQAVQDVKYEGNQPGRDGRDGKDGERGADGRNGKDGRSVARTFIADNGALVVQYTDGTMDILGVVIGRDGRDGKDGRDGTDGKDGLPGENGKAGNAGADGKNGLNGADGTNGQDGINGTNGLNGKDGTDGKNGIDGKAGQNGKDGIHGLNGRDGKNGIDGKDGSDGMDLTVAPSRPAGRVLLGTVGRLTADRKPPGLTNTLNIPDDFARAVTLLVSDCVGSACKIEGQHSCTDGVVTWIEWDRKGAAAVKVEPDQGNRGLAVTAMTTGTWTCRMVGSPE